jgi:signal transduction histidine kinase
MSQESRPVRNALLGALEGSRHVPPAGKLLAVALTYYLLARLGVALGVPPDGIAVFWPPNAIVLCTFLIFPTAQWWAFALGFLCAEIVSDIPVFTIYEAIGFGVVNCFEGALSALVLRRVFGTGFDLSTARQLLYFVVVCVVAAPSIAALGGAAIYVAGGSQESFLLLWRTWWAGDAVGLVAFGPIILTLWRRFHIGWTAESPARQLELILALLLLAAVTAVAFRLDWFIATDYYQLFYIYPLLVWIALRGRVAGAAAAGTIIAAVVAWMAVAGEIPVGVSGRFEDVLFLQQFLAITILSTLTLGTLVQEMASLNERLRIELEQTRSEKEMLEAKERAERASAAKTSFIAQMSHELRTPLNAIIGFSSSIRKEVFGPLNNERYSQYLGHIEESAQHLLSLINDLIDISKIEAGEVTLSEDTVRPVDAIAGAFRIMEAAAAAKRITLEDLAPPELPRLRCDQMRLQQILINLIGNAMKFSPEGSRVEVSAGCKDGRLRLWVRDHGPGIAAADLERAFERFQQFSRDPGLRAQGSGLGLYISRSLMQAHGGEIAIDSTVGEGTTVTLEFPAERVVHG